MVTARTGPPSGAMPASLSPKLMAAQAVFKVHTVLPPLWVSVTCGRSSRFRSSQLVLMYLVEGMARVCLYHIIELPT
jgi:hypothetical protein